MTTNLPATTTTSAEPTRTNYLNVTRGFRSWATTLDHKRIGLLYLAGTTLAFLIGGVFALMIRIHLWNPNPNPTDGLFEPDTYNQIFTLHGAFMVFMFIIPAIPGALGNLVLPLMLGAKDVALPRLNLASFYLWLIGTLMAIGAMVWGGVDTGWTFYTPYSIYNDRSVILMGSGIFLIGFSSIFTGLNFIVTVHKLRAPGLTWFKLPLFIWAIYATSILQVLATPVLGITLLLLIFEHAYGIGIFDPKLGGDPVLFQHMFWFYSHPAVYIMILPALGIISDVISVHTRKPLFGYKMIAFSSIAIAVISFLVWGHHMFTSGQSEFAMFAFSFLTFFVGVPTAIKVFSWVATIWKGSIILSNPMLYALSFLVIFTIGGLTGIFLAVLNLDIHLHDTYFVVAHFHYVMMGSTAMALFAGVHHWWPKFIGKTYSRFWSRVACALTFIGFNLTFFPQFVMGAQGMPRRYASYLEEFTIYHRLSTVGALILATSIVIMVGYFLHSIFAGKKAAANQWGGVTLEWKTASPPPLENFDEEPVWTGDVYDYRRLSAEEMTR